MIKYKTPYKQLNRKVNTWCNYTSRIDTYGLGCDHDCSYCYAKSLLNFRGKWNNSKQSDFSEIYYNIKKIPRYSVIRLGSMSDCFQPKESKTGITFETIKLLNKYKIHYLIVTKGSLCSNEKYLKIYDHNLAHFQITITSTNNEISSIYEHASKVSDRIKSIEKLNLLGFDTTIRLSPFIEQNIDFEALNSIKCDKILIEFLKVNYWIKKWFNIDYSDYTLKYGGYEHLQLSKKIILVNKITGFKQKTVGEYVKEHHEYFKENVNYNRNDCCNVTYNDSFVPKYTQLKLF